jgi:flavin reductase (DIM6/NTAB) family NADH-FMN oxidoreductase RutF
VTIVPKKAAASEGMDSSHYRALMRHQAGAVTVIAAGSGDARAGLTATAVASLSDNPPTILACIQRKAGAHDRIAAVKSFSVNVLASDQQEIAERFAGRQGTMGEARFEGFAWSTLKSGAPILVRALASLDCELIDRHEFTTHSIFIGRVLAGQFRAEAQPLLYFRGDYWDLGER